MYKYNPTLWFRTLVVGCALVVSGNAAALLPFESTGNIYVSMWVADEIAVFQPDGTPVERFTADGLDGPRGIAFNPVNGEIWIAGEFSNAIHIFDYQHQFLRTLEHEDFNEPVGVTFSANNEVYVSNSNGNEIMVFDQAGAFQRRFTAPNLSDPNCSAFMQDGTLMVSNRLGGSNGARGAVTKFDAQDNFLFDFTTDGILSLMAVARDPNIMPAGFDDTVWATSGAGDSGIYEFDQDGNLLTTILPADIGDGRSVTPQGIAFDSNGDFYVVSFTNEVIKFDSNGNFLMRFPTGSGTARSTAFQGCQQTVDGRCVPFGAGVSDMVSDETGNNSMGIDTDADGSVASTNETTETSTASDSGSGGGIFSLVFLFTLLLYRRKRSFA